MKTSRLVLLGTLMAVPYFAIAETTTRSITLGECISLALTNNLDIQIQTYGPNLAHYALGAAYGDYDPGFTLGGTHSKSESGSQLISGGLSVPGAITEDDRFNSGLGGLLPWGMRYDLIGRTSDTH